MHYQMTNSLCSFKLFVTSSYAVVWYSLTLQVCNITVLQGYIYRGIIDWNPPWNTGDNVIKKLFLNNMLLEIKDLVIKLPKYTHYKTQIFQNKLPFEIHPYDSLLPIFICETSSYIYFVWFCGSWSFWPLKAQWLLYVLCVLTLKNSAFYQQSALMCFI
jgi:hypothetical protein